MLLGRDADLDAVAPALDDPARPVALYGEAGVGKTALIRAAVHDSGRIGFEAGCLATLSWMPYLPLHRAFGSAATAAATAGTAGTGGTAGTASTGGTGGAANGKGGTAVGTAGGTPDGARPGRWAALDDLRTGDPAFVAAEVENAVGDGLLVIDDAQWADAETRRLLPLLVGRVRMLAAVRRGDSGAPGTLELLRTAGFTVHELDPLGDAYAGALARRVRPDLSRARVADVVLRSGGNPLLVEELAGTEVPGAGLRLALEARMRRLPEDCREAVILLALADRPLPEAALGDALATVTESGLLRRDGGLVSLRHGLLAELACQTADPAVRAALHERLAGLADEPGQAARHLLAAGQPRRAHDAALRAAAAAASPGERAQHLGLAASCLEGPEAAALRLDAAEQLAQVGQYLAAEPLLAGIDTAEPIAAARTAAILLRLRYEAMDRDGCRAALRAGLAAATGTGHPIEVRLACEQAFVALMVDFDVDAAVTLADRAAELAEVRGVHRARARYILGTASYIAGRPDWEENLGAAVELAREEGELAVECAAGNNLITAHESSGVPERGREIADHMIDRAQLLHLTEWRQQYEAMRLNLAWHGGDYPAVLADGAKLLAESLRPITRRQVRMTICLALVDTGRVDDAFAMIEAIIAEQADDDTFQESVHAHRAEALLWDGKPARALAEWPAHRESTTHMMDLLAFSAPTFAWAALLADEPVPEFGDLTPTTRMCRAGPLEVAGVRAWRAGDFDRAAEMLDRAAELWQPYNVRNTVRTRWGAAEAVRRAGRASDAVTRLLAAERQAAEHAMVPLLGHIRTSLRAAGVARSAPRAAGWRSQAGPGGATGAASLSGREREVLSLAGQGLSDTAIGARLGISPRTVESQLASARRKLGARTRHQAAAMLLGA